jgi:photosystem II stability/assembly factor-like uncharacterized protein
MNNKYFLLSLLLAIIFILTSLSFAQPSINNVQDEEHQRFDYRRQDPNNLPPLETYAQPKEEVSPNGYDIKHLNKIIPKDIWTELHPQVPRVNYWGVYFIDKDTGLATGELGAIIKTTDSGNSWYNIETGYNKTIRSIASYLEKKIIAIGDSGLIISSTDFGESWELVQSGTNNDLWHIKMINSSLGWIVGMNSTLLKTTDGGSSWQLKTTPLQGYNFFDISFLDSSFGYIACFGGLVLRTMDGGDSWDVRQAGDQYSLTVIRAITRLEAVAIGFAGKFVRTNDGGETWQFIGYLGDTFREMAFIDTLKGFAVTTASGYETTDGGRNWTVRYDIKHGNGIVFANNGIGYKVSTGLSIEKTTNYGESWNRAIINDYFTDLFFTDENNGWFIGLGVYDVPELFQTTDGGITLIQRNDFPGLHPSSIYFLDSLNGIVGADNSIYKTTDGGILWEEKNVNGVDSVAIAGEFDRIFFINDNMGWALNTKYVIKTIDGGENWQSQLITAGLSGIHFSDTLNGWITRIGGGIYKPFKTTDGGETWTEQNNFPSNDTRDVFFNDSLNGLITRNNELYYTANGGLTWSLITNVTDFSSGRFSNKINNDIFLSGNRVYKSSDAGETWNEVLNLRDNLIEYIRLLDINQGYAVGWRGLILRYSDSVVNVGENQINIPSEYRLYQNYPNPFNFGTKIEFQLPETASVKLVVYNILGEKIIELINERLNAGYYEFAFNGEHLSSATYIYTLQTENYQESRKMILLK